MVRNELEKAIESLSYEQRINLRTVIKLGLKSARLPYFAVLRKPQFTCPNCHTWYFRTLFRGTYHNRPNVPFVICLNCGWMGWDAIFSDGFDPHGDFSLWTQDSGGNSVINTNAHHGTYSADMTSWVRKNIGSESQFYLRCYAYLTPEPANNNASTFLIMGPAANPYRFGLGHSWLIGENPRWFAANGEHSVAGSFDEVLVLRWCCIELYGKVSATVGEIEVFRNGTKIIDLSGLNTGADNIENVYIMNDWTGVPNAIHDCVVADTAYIGPESGGGTGGKKNLAMKQLYEMLL